MLATVSTTQPIICCLGENVAGQPTQFLLERAFDAGRFDWRALTVEIPTDKFSLVCEAMSAMGFRGLRFFSDCETLAAQQLAPSNSIWQFVGSVTSAFGERNSPWSVWDNYGFAILRWAAKQNSLPFSVWLHGDSRYTRSTFAALINSTPQANWIWTAAPIETVSTTNLRGEESETNNLLSVLSPRLFAGLESITIEQVSRLLECQQNSAEHIQDLAKRPCLLVTADQALDATWSEMLAHLHISPIISDRCTWPEAANIGTALRFTTVDLVVAGEAYDFERWTGKSIDTSLLHDAYDEYCDL